MSTKTKMPGSRKRPSNQGGKAAAVVQKIVALHGGKLGLATKLAFSISRPLLVALCTGAKPTSATSVAELCRACPSDLAEELIAAHLDDELHKIRSRYQRDKAVWENGAIWSGNFQRGSQTVGIKSTKTLIPRS